MKKLAKLIVILGPTAVGKTTLAIKLAKKFNGEIVSADSRQVYKEMDIGTAKPKQETSDKRQETSKYIVNGVPHYLIDIVWPNQEFNVAIYKKMALEAIRNIRKRKKVPFLVGGTGLYIQAVVDNIDFPRVLPQKRLRAKLEKKTKRELFKIYKKLDPEGAKFIDKENKRRLVRAIEICKMTKKPYWQQRKKRKSPFDIFEIGIKLPKEKLKKRVKKRIDKMFRLGLEEEVKKLAGKYGFEIPAMQTIGYQEWSSFAKATGDKQSYIFSLTKEEKREIKEKIKLHTIQFAKRQMTWFKHDKRIHWVGDCQEAKKLIRKFLKNTKKRA